MPRGLALLIGLLAVHTAFAESLPSLSSAQVDAKGVVWAIRSSGRPAFLSYENGKVTNQQVEGLDARAEPTGLGSLADGAVVCLWRLDDHTVAMSRHLGKESRFLGNANFTQRNSQFEGMMTQDSWDGLWITGRQPEILHLNSDGQLKTAYTITHGDLIGSNQKRDFNPIRTVQDGQGRILVFSALRASNWASLRGLLIFDRSGAMQRQENIAGIDTQQFTAIACKDDHSLWVGVPKRGLFVVNSDTFTATPVEPPEEDSFANVLEIMSAGDDLYVIAGKKLGNLHLWRLHEGQWAKVIEEMDNVYYTTPLLVSVAGGLVINGISWPWYLRDGTQAVRLDWSNGFPLEGVRSFTPLPDGRYLIVGRGTFLGKLQLPPAPSPSLRTKEFQLWNNWTTTPNGHVWLMERERKNILREWDGQAWADRPLPEGLTGDTMGGLEGDEQGRVWLMPGDSEKPMAFWESDSSSWKVFPHIREAFLAVAHDPPTFPEPNERMRLWKYFHPTYDKGRVLYRNVNGWLNYYDGAEWHKWLGREITGDRSTGSAGPPFFDAQGQPSVNFKKTTWTFIDGKWGQTPYDSTHPEESERGLQNPFIPLPDGLNMEYDKHSVLRDSRGIYWFLSGGQLYKGTADRKIRVFSDLEPNPFTTNRGLDSIFVDPQGTAFIRTVSDGNAWFMISPREGKPPRTTLVLRHTAEDAVEANVNTEATGPTESRWRLNDEPWRSVGGGIIKLTGLPIGQYTLRVETFDEELRDDPSPCVARFEIKAMPPDQIEKLISQLSDHDYNLREEAIISLTRQPSITLPALRRARATATADQQWWIDAAIQEIERARKKTQK